MNCVLQDTVKTHLIFRKKKQSAVTKVIKKGNHPETMPATRTKTLEWAEKSGLWKVTADRGKPHGGVALFYVAFQSRASAREMLLCFLPSPGEGKTKSGRSLRQEPLLLPKPEAGEISETCWTLHTLCCASTERFVWSPAPRRVV